MRFESDDNLLLLQARRGQSLAGKPNTASKRCARIAGTGSGIIRKDIDKHSVFIMAVLQ